MHESKESTEGFEFLACRNILVLPGGAESAHPIYIEGRQAWESVQDGEILQLTKEQAIFVERRLAQVPSLCVHEKFVASFPDRERLRFFDLLPFGFPSAH